MTLSKLIQQREIGDFVDDLPGDLHPVLKRIYRGRDVRSSRELDQSLGGLLEPGGLLNIGMAVQLLTDAIKRQQRILIVADFDADGATSCAVAVRALHGMGARHVSYLVPDRVTHGYGLTPEIVEAAVDFSPELIITVDNGISSCAGIAAARERGIRVLVTDHHLPGDELPVADAIVNPNQPGDTFASKALAGVGVIFYVMMALRAHLRGIGWFEQHNLTEPNLAQLLDLVALGTVADLVPLDRNNRVLVAQGLARINSGQSVPGIRALLELAGRKPGQLTTADLGFFVAPRLNAAGRLEDMSLGIECLLTDSSESAGQLGAELDRINRERREIQNDMQEQAMCAIEALHLEQDGLPKGLCLYDDGWHQGVVGLVASKIKERHHRPVVALAPGGNGEIKGSARSIPGLHIRDTLDAIAARHPSLIQKFGGHAMAAGLTISAQDLEAFSRAFADAVGRQLSEDDLGERILTDGVLDSNDLVMQFAETIRTAGPWGQGFPEPVFEGQFNVISSRVVGGKHVKMQLREPGGKELDAIAFNHAPDGMTPDWSEIKAAYRLDINEFRGMRSLQLIVEYMESLSPVVASSHERYIRKN